MAGVFFFDELPKKVDEPAWARAGNGARNLNPSDNGRLNICYLCRHI